MDRQQKSEEKRLQPRGKSIPKLRVPELEPAPSLDPRAPGGNAEPRAARIPARGPRAGMHGAGWRERARQKEALQGDWQVLAVSIEMRRPMAATEAVYRGGASPWQPEKPSERLLIAGPAAAGVQIGAVGREGGAKKDAGGALERRPESRRGVEELLPEPSLGPGCALNRVSDGTGCRWWRERGHGSSLSDGSDGSRA